MRCSVCQSENPDGSRFCANCASELSPLCAQCDAPVLPGSKFCGQCGAPIVAPVTCGACGASVPAGSKFCHECGGAIQAHPEDGAGQAAHAAAPQVDLAETLQALMPERLRRKISKEAPQIRGERREVTVLVLDVTNFTAASNRLDSEEMYLIVDEAMRLLVEILYKYEGTVDKFTGDGLVALFGAPVTHENDPERAVRAALEMLDALKPLRARTLAEHNFDLQVRIGINTGVVIAGSMGSNLHMEYTVIGDTVTLAATLEGAAEPGTILVSFSTYQRTHPLFDYTSISLPATSENNGAGVTGYRPERLRKTPGRVRGLAGLQAPMVGRHAFLQTLEKALERLLEEQGARAVVISGEAGLGKSRLVAEFRRRLRRTDVDVFEGSCLAYARSTPFWVIGSLLRDMMNLSETDPLSYQQQRIRAFLQELNLPETEFAPYLFSMLGLRQASSEVARRLEMMDPSMLQRQIHVVLHQVFHAQARKGPAVLVFEDIHWIDSASRNFLCEFLRSSTELPFLHIFVTREYERDSVVQPVLTALAEHPAWDADIHLSALPPEEGRFLIERLLKQAGLFAPELAEIIARRAEGNPFYIEEIVRMLLDQRCQGGSGRTGDTDDELSEATVIMDRVPGTLTGLILARFDKLEPLLRQHLQLAAVIGRAFPARLLQILTDASTEEIASHLEELTARQFFIEESFGDELGYAFRHALIQEAIYATLLKRDRRALHKKVAETLETHHFLGLDERIEALAYHYSHSGQPKRAIPYLISAAQNAARRSGYENAIQFYHRALALFDEEPTQLDVDYCKVHIGLGEALKLSGELQEARMLLTRAYEHLSHNGASENDRLTLRLEALRELADVAQREGDFSASQDYLEEALALARPLRGAPLWYTLIERMAWVQYRLGQLDVSASLAQQAIRQLEEADERHSFTVASLYNTLGGIAWQQGNLAEAISYVEGSLAMYEREGYTWGISVACANLGVLHWTLGQWSAATKWYERAARLQEENGFNFERATALRNLGYLYLAQGDLDRAHRNFQSALVLCTQQNHAFGILSTHLALASLAVEEGSVPEMVKHLDAAEPYLESADQESLLQFDLMRALQLAHEGSFTVAEALARKSLEQATEGGLQAEVVEAHYVLGQVLRKSGAIEEAEHHLRETVQQARSRNAPDRQVSALLDLADLYQSLADAEGDKARFWLQKALVAAEEAVVVATKLGAPPRLEQAQRIFQAIEQKRAAHEDPDGFSPTPHRPQEIPDGRRGPVTVLWVDLETPSGEDIEEVFEALQEIFLRLERIVAEHSGQMIRRDRGVTVVFGAPTAFEDDSIRAVRCASRITEALAERESANGIRIQAHVGVSAGDAVSGFVHDGRRNNFVVAGESVYQAEGIASRTPAGKVWVSSTVRALTDRICTYRAPGLATEKADNLPVFELVTAPKGDVSHRNLPGASSRMIGRDRVMQLLMEQANRLPGSQGGGIVWLEGEAGIGKSRLLREFTARLPRDRYLLGWGECSPHRTRQAFSLFSSLLLNLLGIPATGDVESQRVALHARVSDLLSESGRLTPYLELLCGIPLQGEDAEKVADLEPEALRQQIFVAARTLMIALARRRPLVLILDDLHWIDPMSAYLLSFLAYMMTTTEVLFICAMRPGEGGDGQKEVEQLRTVHEARSVSVRLERLSAEDGEALILELLGDGRPAPALRDFILRRSEGNPYYIEEFLRLLIEQGYVHQEGDQWVPVSDQALDELPLPATLEALLRSRVDALPPQPRHLLQLAAVVGRPFERSLLEQLAPEIEEMDGHLQELAQRNLLVSVENGRQWQFGHHLAQIVVYNSMLKIRLKALHQQVAQLLESMWRGEESQHAEELAFHFARGGEMRQALHYQILAGERAASRYANEEALDFFCKARQILRESGPEASACMRWRVAVGLADAYRRTGHFEDSLRILRENLDLLDSEALTPAQQAGLYRRMGMAALSLSRPEEAYDHFRQALVRLGEPEDREGQAEAARTLHGLTYTHFRRGQLERARESGELSRLYAERAQDRSELAAAENLIGGVYYQLDDYAAAMEHTTNAMRIREELGDSWDVASTLGNLGVLSVVSGDWVLARTYFERSLAMREELGDVDGVALIHHNLGLLSRLQGHLEDAVYHFQESLRVAEAFNMVYHQASAQLGLAEICILRKEVHCAQELLDCSVSLARQADAQDMLSEAHRVQAEIYLVQGRYDAAAEEARLAAKFAAKTGSVVLEANAWQMVAECAMAQGQLAAAELALLQAKRSVHALPDSIDAGRVALRMARLRQAQGRSDEAQTEFEQARRIFSQLGATYELQQLDQEVVK